MAKAAPDELGHLPSLPTLGIFDPVLEARRLFAFMKAAESMGALQARSLMFKTPDGAEYQLTPIGNLHLNNRSLVRELMEWRQSYPEVFVQDADLSEAGTERWLRDHVVLNPDRILFLVEDSAHNRLGHLGIWIREGWRFELDNVVKSPDISIKGLMSAATVALGRWCNEFTGTLEIYLRVLRSNTRAINFYQRLGFEIRDLEVTDLRSSEETQDFDVSTDDEVGSSVTRWHLMSRSTEEWNSDDHHVLTAGPSIGPLELSLTSDAVRSGWNHHHSDYLAKFSESFAEYVGARYAIPTDSCTSALHLALWALGIGPGDEVIVPEITWVATANAARYVGATPVFADIDAKTWCINPESVKALITPKTRAIIPVHLYGYVADLAEIERLCVEHGIHLVQDAAPGIGSMFGSRGVAQWGEFSCFSFQGAKLLVSGEGGVLTTNDERLYEAAFKIGDSGRRPGTFWIELLGKKMKMSNLTASLALAQLMSAERQIARKRQIRDWYLEELAGVPNIAFQEELPNTRSICWMTSVHISTRDFNREVFRQQLLERGIDTRPVFSPISRYPYWETSQEEGPTASQIGDSAINLPSGVGLSHSTVVRVANAVKELVLD